MDLWPIQNLNFQKGEVNYNSKKELLYTESRQSIYIHLQLILASKLP